MKKVCCGIFIALSLVINTNMTVCAKNIPINFDREEMINVTVYERVNPSIVSIDATVPDGISSGSGCIIDGKGLILTSKHVIEDASSIEITTTKGEVYKATLNAILGQNSDLALLKITPKSKLIPITLGDSSQIKVGQKVLAIGNPFGFNGTLTTGIISRIDYERNKIQTDAAINPGSSGGPLVNVEGEVIGISQSIFNPDNNKSNIGIGFAIPVNDAKQLISDYRKNPKSLKVSTK
ncbi:MAG: trypsin-like peptidase domain-containing protein [Candidatus Gastranaerophilales bacterium]|nr:trypsin-like peptidase domain-containing protein [Candidatus Gastranaerophilales bacterium]